jgi:trk system potassium uptake protein TrkH
MQWAVILAMAVGASPGGTAGGIKTTTLAQLWDGTRRTLRGQPVNRTFGIALMWMGIYLGLAMAAVLTLMMTENKIPGERVLFLAVSALSNVGLAHNELSISVSGTYILCAVMLLGRMTPLLILWWMADTTREAEVAIG